MLLDAGGIVNIISRFVGFALRIASNGSRSFVSETSTRGRSKPSRSGSFPIMTVALARQKSLQFKAAIAAGEDPFSRPEGAEVDDLSTR